LLRRYLLRLLPLSLPPPVPAHSYKTCQSLIFILPGLFFLSPFWAGFEDVASLSFSRGVLSPLQIPYDDAGLSCHWMLYFFVLFFFPRRPHVFSFGELHDFPRRGFMGFFLSPSGRGTFLARDLLFCAPPLSEVSSHFLIFPKYFPLRTVQLQKKAFIFFLYMVLSGGPFCSYYFLLFFFSDTSARPSGPMKKLVLVFLSVFFGLES